MFAEIDRAVGVLWDFAPVVVCDNFTMIGFASFGVCKVFNVIANRDNDLVGDKSFVYQVQHKKVCHFTENEFRFLCFIGSVKHLTRSQTVCAGSIFIRAQRKRIIKIL